MIENRQKSYGKRYFSTKVKVKINRKKMFFIIGAIAIVSEMIVGIICVLI